MCTRCGRLPPEPGLKVCGDCAEKRRAADRARRAKARAEGKQYGGRDPERCRRADRAGDKRRRRARQEAGLCTSCGRRQPEANRSVCEPCRKARRALDRRRYAARKAAGRCVRCTQPTLGGLSRCGRCLALEKERISPERESAVSKRRYAEQPELAAAPRRPFACPRGLAYARLGLAKGQPTGITKGRVQPLNPGETARWRAPATRSSVARTPVK